MDRLIAIDPGKHAVGYALFRGHRLIACGLLSCYSLLSLRRSIDKMSPTLAIVEEPKVYAGKAAKGDPDDLIQLAKVAGAAGSVLDDTKFVKPGEWKGQVPKDIHNKRVIEALEPADFTVYKLGTVDVPAGKRHNVIDAVGLGLYGLKVYKVSP